MRPPSILVPVGAVVAAVGINLPVVSLDVHLSDSVLPGISDLVNAVPEHGLGASDDQRYYLLGVVALAVLGWLLPRLVPRTTVIGFVLAVAALAGSAFAAYRGWAIAIGGPKAVLTGDTSFLERTAVDVLDALHSRGVLVVDPASGLWVLSAGVALLVVGVALTLRRPTTAGAR